MTDINRLTQAEEFTDEMQVPVYDPANRRPRKISGAQWRNVMEAGLLEVTTDGIAAIQAAADAEVTAAEQATAATEAATAAAQTATSIAASVVHDAAEAAITAIQPYLGSAQDAQTGAEAAEAQAAIYSSLAATGSKFFDTIALGRAAVADAATFGVKAGGSDGLAHPTIYRRDSALAETLLYQVLAWADLDALLSANTSLSEYAWAVLDASGRAAFGVLSDGTLSALDANITTLTAGTASISTLQGVNSFNGAASSAIATVVASLVEQSFLGYEWAVLDGAGRAAMGVRTDGTVAAAAIEADTLTATDLNATTFNGVSGDDLAALLDDTPPGFASDIAHVVSYGQSLSIGVNATPPVSTTQPYDSLKFQGGVRSTDNSGVRYSSLVPLTEGQVGSNGETPCAGMAHAVKQLILSENGISFAQQSYQLLLSADGEGGKSVAELSQGSAYFGRITGGATAAFGLAQAAGKTYQMPAMLWTQGEQDYSIGTSIADYKVGVRTLLSDANTAVKAITGQPNDMVMISYQTASHKHYSVVYPSIALAQLEMAREGGGFYMAAPTYMLAYGADEVHLTASSSKKLGFYYGLAYKRVVIDGVKWRPLMPISKFAQGAVCTVRFHVPVGKLVFDTTLVAANTNMGFNLFKSDGTEITISSVTITGPDTIRILAAESIPAGAKLQYAFYGAGVVGSTTGPRGNLRDQQGDTIIFDPAGLNYAAHNWCVMFEEIF